MKIYPIYNINGQDYYQEDIDKFYLDFLPEAMEKLSKQTRNRIFLAFHVGYLRLTLKHVKKSN